MRWGVMGLLLLATTINYMDRVTLANASVRVTSELGLSETQYGHLELAFGWAFALGSLIFGRLADRVRIEWLYPAVLLGWSAMGMASGWTGSFHELMVCRVLLGFFEAGHWPCALKTTEALLSQRERTMGNSILQSGASIGAMITPQIMLRLMDDQPGSWRRAFVVIGALGIVWALAWFVLMRGRLPAPKPEAARGVVAAELWALVRSPRFVALAILIAGAQCAWHINRVWLMKFLQTGRGYPEAEALGFQTWYYLSTDVGCFAAGALSLWLARRGLDPHQARRRVYLLACGLTSLSLLLPSLARGPGLLAVLLLIGAGALALFPCYYSFVQELSVKHVGFAAGVLSMWVWLVTSPLHSVFGWVVDRVGSYDAGLVLAGLMPWMGAVAMWRLWRSRPAETEPA